MKLLSFSFLVIAALFFSPKEPYRPAQKPAVVTAISTNDFLNSIGVNSAISRRGESLDKTIQAIRYTGIRWIRSGYEGGATDQDYQTLHRETGTRFSYGLMSGGTNIDRLLTGGRMLAASGALLAFEGNNEPNNWGVTYNGEKGGKNQSWLAVAKLQADMYKAVKADPALQQYPVWSISEGGAQVDNVGLQFLKIPAGPDGKIGAIQYADYATCHNYFSHPSHKGLYDNQTWNAADPGPRCKVDGLFGNYGKTWRSKLAGYTEDELINLPKVTTETGVTIDNTFTEEKQARLYLNLYLAQFKRKWSYTAIYLLRDRSDEAGNQSFGFYQKDYSPRKAAVYLHNFTTILADKAIDKKAPGSLAYKIANQPETVHDLLLQNSNGKFQLVIWGEKATGTEEIKLSLGKKAARVNVYDPTVGISPVANYKNVNEVTLTLSDHPVVVEL
jgi:hypothetical protein